jgi:hypothetical protein
LEEAKNETGGLPALKLLVGRRRAGNLRSFVARPKIGGLLEEHGFDGRLEGGTRRMQDGVTLTSPRGKRAACGERWEETSKAGEGARLSMLTRRVVSVDALLVEDITELQLNLRWE